MITDIEKIVSGNKLIAVFDGYIYPYKKDIWKGGYCMKNVDLLSKIKFVSLEDVLRDSKTINTESRPFETETGISISKYGSTIFWNNVLVFSTDSDEIPVTIAHYNERFQRYHDSMDWLMPICAKIETIVYNEKFDKDSFETAVDLLTKIKKSCMRFKPYYVWEAVIEFIKWYNENKGNI